MTDGIFRLERWGFFSLFCLIFYFLPLIGRTRLGRTSVELGGRSWWGRRGEVCLEGGWQQEAGSLRSSRSIWEAVGRSRDQSTGDRNERKNFPEAEEAGHGLLQLRKSLSWPRLGCEARICLHLLL